MTAEEYRALLAVDFGDVELGSLTDISKTQDRQRAAFGKTQTAVFEKSGQPLSGPGWQYESKSQVRRGRRFYGGGI